MKVITEAILRDELRNSEPEIFYIPEGKILSPAAREYLQQRKIKILKGPAPEPSPVTERTDNKDSEPREFKPKYVDYDTGAFYMEKPEHMCQLYDNVLVPKDHPRILFRGKLDSLQSLVVLNQALIAESGCSERLLSDLGNVLEILREIMRCDVLNEEYRAQRIIGLSHTELREHSHNPMKYYKIKQMLLPDYTMGKQYAMLNQLRTAIRETEVAATGAFHEGTKYGRQDIIQELNRLSSALHIIMCKYLAGDYNK